MKTKRLYEDRGLDLHELWRKARRSPPGSIISLPAEDGDRKGRVKSTDRNKT